MSGMREPKPRPRGCRRTACAQVEAGARRMQHPVSRHTAGVIPDNIMINALRFSFAAAALALSPIAGADVSVPTRAVAWPDTFVARVEALALVESLDAELLSHDSATATLERWCSVHRLASPARIVAERVPLEKPLSAEQRQDLAIGAEERVRYRRVRLLCGYAVLSEADNWYVPSRLSADMRERLNTTDVPFGKVVQALHFQRRTLSSKRLWRPLPDGWEMMPATEGDGAKTLIIPRRLLEHRALLTLPDGTPISEVVETYTSDILGFSPPRP
jgi:chorismate-pyruvate lyase